jgi:hypothetical protein
MPRKLLLALLAAGTVGGFASGFSSLAWRMKSCRAQKASAVDARAYARGSGPNRGCGSWGRHNAQPPPGAPAQ